MASLAVSRVATCACGQLSVRCNREPTKISLCHCLECQKRTGSSHGIAAFFRRADVEPRGQAQQFTRSADSGFAVTFHFCPNCGSSVYWEPSRIPEAIAVAVGCFADPAFPQPSQSVYGQHRHLWAKFPD
jgi:hypothetical protein